MAAKTTPEHQAWLRESSKRDPTEKMEHMMAAIGLGASKADCGHLIENEQDARTWDRLAAQIAEIHARGWMVVYRVDGWD